MSCKENGGQSGWRPVTYDLHQHSCLSPCGDEEMTPANIVGMAVVKELDVIALTDHNTCKNCPAFLKVAEAYGVVALPGMELTTTEEVHVVCLFEKLEDAMAFDAYVYEHLMDIKNEESIFGAQLIVNEDDEVIGKVDKLLINATDIDFDAVAGLMEQFHGVMIPAHLDKSTTSLLSNLGFIPPDSTFGIAEIKDLKNLHRLQEQHPYLKDCMILSDSDAHYLPDIHEPTYTMLVPELSVSGVFAALKAASKKK
ncbi:MAG: PHP domain-containing protein [Lachnospiraceae bacterium]|nr:PHP domain-containing protein [Lachnospiraceae bacterium]